MPSLLERAWEQREQEVYPSLFGNLGEGIYTLSFELFQQQFGSESIDPRWMHYGVFKSPPNEHRPTWLYVSSGMSNPWEADDAGVHSGLGSEFVLEAKNDAPWAIPLLQSLIAFNILVSIGKYGDRPILGHWDRIPQSIEPNISHFVLGLPISHPETIELVSGEVDLLQVVGITREEFAYAKEFGSPAICSLLQEHGVYPVTDPDRSSVTLS